MIQIKTEISKTGHLLKVLFILGKMGTNIVHRSFFFQGKKIDLDWVCNAERHANPLQSQSEPTGYVFYVGKTLACKA